MPPKGDAYERFVKPLVSEYLRAAGLDVAYHRASGDRLYYEDERGHEVEVLDFVGGFGASLFGHNHPEIAARATEVLTSQRPFHAQASVRDACGRLGERLARLAERATGRRFYVTFANSGAEAVEAAIKHAEMQRQARVEAIVRGIVNMKHELRRKLRDHRAQLSPDLFRDAARACGVAEIGSLDDLVFRLYALASEQLDRPPMFLAIEGAFHGKTSGSVKLTYRPEYQAPWRRIGPQSMFIPAGDLHALERTIEAHTIPLHDIEVGTDGVARLVERRFCNIAACFVEPIQGEGGVHELEGRFLDALRQATAAAGVPLVLDEIQSGMGRTGRFFAAEHQDLRGDYYLLSKSLGGGLAKISALLVDEDHYVREFGFVHTSTFADDDFSSEVALAALDLVEADDGALMRRCAARGEDLIAGLEAVQREFPDQIADVRGRGLMVGVELADQARSASPMLRVISEQDLLGFVVSGYLLHEERIRVAPTLSSRTTLRLEPSAFIESSDIERLCAALRRLAAVLRAADSHRLLRFVVGRAGEPARESPAPRSRPAIERDPAAARVAFLAHFLEPGDLVAWDPQLAPMSAADCARFFERTRGILEPFVAGEAQLHSALGRRVHATIVAVPFVPDQVLESMRSGDGQWAIDLVHRGVELARGLGASVVGFGGYTSIVTNNCRSVVPSDVALTSGNSLTAAAALESAALAAARLGLERRVLGVIGAAGNIGRVFAEVAADDVDEIVLVGRPRARRRLERAAATLYARVARRAVDAASPSRLGERLRASGLLDGWDALADGGGTLYTRFRERLGDRAPIRVAEDMSALRSCNMILSATNSARPVVDAEHVADSEPVVISDVAVPADVDARVLAERPNAVLLRGGMVRTPGGQSVEIDGMDLAPGELYGCLGETLLMGLAGIGESLSYGDLEPLKVRYVRDLARMHGFTIEENPVRVVEE